SLTLTDYFIDNILDLSSKSSLVLDEDLDLEELTLDTLKSFEKIAPYGMDNKKPVLYIIDFQVESARTMGKNNAHLKLR
ncbi:single-stranded-DNA-specific exonuclease RecJ, partial [Streptococcus suis]